MSICVIPARGGSKRIPKKNIKKFDGNPIISYSIEAALQSGCFDKVIVSTDDQDIANVATDYGAEVPFIRPAYLSDDYATTLSVLEHAIKWCNSIRVYPKHVCCLYATAPFVSSQSILESYQLLKASDANYCFSVTEYNFPIQRALKILPSNRVSMFQPAEFNTRSQDLETAYHDAGQFYWGSAGAFLKQEVIFSENAIPYIIPHYLVQDIDSPNDWIQAEKMYQLLKQTGLC